MRYGLTGMRWTILCILLLGSHEGLHAQPGILTLSRGSVVASLDSFSGRFGAMRADGRTMLFQSGSSLTSHISATIDGVIWTNYTKSQMYAPWPQRNLGRGTVERLSDRLRYTWAVRTRGGTVRIVQELEPVHDSLYQEVRVHLAVENTSGSDIRAGITIVEDVDAGGDDYVPLRRVAGVISREYEFRAPDIAERLIMLSPAFLPDTAHCRFQGTGVVQPDRVIVGRWSYHGGLGTAVYGYQAANNMIGDAAVFLQWDEQVLNPGAYRTAGSAVGFHAPQPAIPGTTCFARDFVVPLITSRAILTIVSDTAATVVVRMPYTDANHESQPNYDGRWDTTIVVMPQQPVSLVISHRSLDRLHTDSLTFYRQSVVLLQADAEVGVFVRPVDAAGFLDAATVWPVACWDSSYLFHGVMSITDVGILNAGIASHVNIEHSHRYGVESFTDWYVPQKVGYGFPLDAELSTVLPQYGYLEIDGYATNSIFDLWDPYRGIENYVYSLGVGDRIESGTRVAVMAIFCGRIWPNGIWGQKSPTPTLQRSYLIQPARVQLGTEYIFIPFLKRTSNTQEDLLRIIAQEDDSDIRIFENSPALHLDAGGYVDTLVGRATVIRGSKPFAVYQHHLYCHYLNTDTSYAGGAMPLLPHGLWGKRYFSVTDDAYKPNVQSVHDSFHPFSSLRYDNLYFILVTKAAHRGDVRINGVPVDSSRFTLLDGFAFAYVDIHPGYHIVSSDHPFLTVSCGGGYFGVRGSMDGVSFVPPYR